MTAPTKRAIERLIAIALDQAAPGVKIAVEAGGVRVEVEKHEPGRRADVEGDPARTLAFDDAALDEVRRRLCGAAGAA